MSTEVWTDVLVSEVCWRLLSAQPVGRLGFVVDGAPHVYPVNHRVDGDSIVFRTAHRATIATLVDGSPVVFEADDADPNAETGWSVLAAGRLEAIEDAASIAALTALGVHAWSPGKDRWVRLRPTHISGRAISRRRDDDGAPIPYAP